MNFGELDLYKEVAKKVSWTQANVANQIREHLRGRIPEVFALPGVWITGSNVWRFVYGDVPDPTSDIDIITERHDGNVSYWAQVVDTLREIGVTAEDATAPSAASRPELNGRKFLLKDGRTVDVWHPCEQEIDHTIYPNQGFEGVLDLLRQYPEHSHAQARAAYSPSLDLLIILPNTKAA